MGTVTLDELHASAEYSALTARQARFLDAWIASGFGSAKEAARLAYGDGPSDRYLTMLSRRLEASEAIQRVLDVYYQRRDRDRDKFLRQLQRDARKQSGIALSQTRALQARIAGLLPCGANLAEMEHAQTFAVGDKVTQRDDAGVLHVGVVKAVDPNGRPTEIQEIRA